MARPLLWLVKSLLLSVPGRPKQEGARGQDEPSKVQELGKTLEKVTEVGQVKSSGKRQNRCQVGLSAGLELVESQAWTTKRATLG